MIFNVRFSVVAFKPFDGEILDGIVTNVDQSGINVHSGPLKCHIAQDRMPGYEYDQTLGQFSSRNVDFKPIKIKSTLRHKIEHLKFTRNNFIAISSIQGDYLGVIQA